MNDSLLTPLLTNKSIPLENLRGISLTGHLCPKEDSVSETTSKKVSSKYHDFYTSVYTYHEDHRGILNIRVPFSNEALKRSRSGKYTLELK